MDKAGGRKSSLPFFQERSSATTRREIAMGVRRMFVTVVAVLCQISGVGCVEEIVTDSNLTPDITFLECVQGAQAPLAKWMTEHPIYHSRCLQGPGGGRYDRGRS